MAGRGGAREGAGRKKKFEEYGQEGQTRPVNIPSDIPDAEVAEWVKQKLAEKRQQDNN